MAEAIKLAACCVGPGICLCLPGKASPRACRRDCSLASTLTPASFLSRKGVGQAEGSPHDSPDAASLPAPQEPLKIRLFQNHFSWSKTHFYPREGDVIWACIITTDSHWCKGLLSMVFPVSLLNVLPCHVWQIGIKDKYLGLLHIVFNTRKKYCYTFQIL